MICCSVPASAPLACSFLCDADGAGGFISSGHGCSGVITPCVWGLVSRLCLLDAVVVCLDASLCHRRLRLASCVPARCLCLLRLVIGSCSGAVPLLLAIRPVPFDTPGGAMPMVPWMFSALLACPSACCPVPWLSSDRLLFRSHPIRFPHSLRSSHRLIVSSLSRPAHATRGRGVVLLVSAACLAARSLLLLDLPCGLFARVLRMWRLRVALLAWLPYYVFVDGGCGSATVRVRPLICLDAPVHPLLFPSPVSTHIAAPGLLLSFHCPGIFRFSFDVPCPVRLFNHGGRGKAFLCVSFLR